ncbi:methyl-accepting chemotaxis protein [Vibrio ulleungensis]|uniref:Methyl-accepting chemotaxis protein n=1 Tax=Vibrio ulleungensis TaxID=2807619 RepID=A0ABS2HL58_9VIBR|nr:methyl-accepting chemotaxis protein [Vibrio ulleungensis]MBM7036794.1 methyl-accepting chemotaxis protein [Vibrio ulleungensis]
MKGSVIRRMYTGFTVIVLMFVVLTAMMLNGMSTIHDEFVNVSNESLPLVAKSNETSIALLSADKLFKDFLTTRDTERLGSIREQFSQQQQSYAQTLAELETLSQSYPSLKNQFTELYEREQAYFAQANEAMDNYQAMFSFEEEVQKKSRDFQRMQSALYSGLKDYVDDSSSISVKVIAKSYFTKLKDAEVTTSDALASSNLELVRTAMTANKKAVTHLNYAYQGLRNQLPALGSAFDKTVEQFSLDVGKKGGVLDYHLDFLETQNTLYENIAILATQSDQIVAQLETFNVAAINALDSSVKGAGEVYDKGLVQALSLSGVVVLLAGFIGYRLANNVRQPLKRILANLESLTAGDMTRRIEDNNNNEFSRVSGHINDLADNLHNILKQLNSASDNLAESASSNQSNSQNAQQKLNTQREQTASVATAMTEMEHSVNEVAQSAQSSQEKVHQVETASESGRRVMSSNITTINQLETRLVSSVEAVGELQRMSSEIGSILDVIRNIAEQTNLLALNAAIEAARAGEQGRGFAVVADEVRVLAQRTTESTSEIETMISNLQSSSESASKVIKSCMSDMEQSVSQASEANSAMEEIQALILEISQMSTYISQAAGEQSQTTSEIARSLEDINHIADENYQAIAKIADVNQSLSELSGEQSSLVHQFKL